MAVQYILCTVLLTVPLAELKEKFVTELVAVLTSHLQMTQNSRNSAVDDVS